MAVQKSRKTPSKRGMHRSHSGPRDTGGVDRREERGNPFPPSHLARRILSRPQGARDQGGRGSGRRISSDDPPATRSSLAQAS